MNTGFASLLVFHGSRDRIQYSTKVARLTALVQKKLWSQNLPNSYSVSASKAAKIAQTNHITADKFPSVLIDAAQLEFAEIELSQKIVNFAQKALTQNYQKITIVPVFLSAGVHVKEDIPSAVAIAQKKLGNSIVLEIQEYIGNSPQLVQLIQQQFYRLRTSEGILLAHGSRLPQGNVAIEQLAQAVDAMVAYWTVQPDLTSRLESLMSNNTSSVAIVPYFLFSGKITKAIANSVNELQQKFPQTKLLLGEPLGATPELAQVIAQQIIQP